MGLEKTKTLPNGTSGKYWKITALNCDKVNLKVTFHISLFINKAHSDAKGSSLDITKVFHFTCTSLELSGDLTALGYAKIKAKANSIVNIPTFTFPITYTQRAYDQDLANSIDV